ncbi:hypothetical protein P4S68_18010 [Pseudoalteromonas sp. Hal099]
MARRFSMSVSALKAAQWQTK